MRRAATQRRRRVVPVILVVLVVVLIAGAALIFVPRLVGERVEAGQEVTLTIPAGASGDDIARLLSERHVIEDPKDYYRAVDDLDAANALKPGAYRLKTLEDPEQVVRQLMAGPNDDSGKLVIPEGLTVAQTAAKVEEVFGIPASTFEAQAKASTYAGAYPFLAGAANDSLEGFLCPKTYTFSSKPTPDEIIRAMLDQFQVEYRQLDFADARARLQSRYGLELSDYQVLTLASIVEREAITHEQRYKVASTFYNRLERGMPLQSDATMMYVTGGAVTAADLKQQSPYNTYLNQGLTPTPICSPSLDSLKAALAPDDTTYLYFFITKDSEYFSDTYDQHLQAIEENR